MVICGHPQDIKSGVEVAKMYSAKLACAIADAHCGHCIRNREEYCQWLGGHTIGHASAVVYRLN